MENYIFIPSEENEIANILRMFQSLFYRNKERVHVHSIRNENYISIGRRISSWIGCSFHVSPFLNKEGMNDFSRMHLSTENRINIFVLDIKTAKLIINLLDPNCVITVPQENTIVRLGDKHIKNTSVKTSV